MEKLKKEKKISGNCKTSIEIKKFIEENKKNLKSVKKDILPYTLPDEKDDMN